jgi:hypothetical protein
MPQEFKVLEVQGRKEWSGGPSNRQFVDWECRVQNVDGTELEVVTTRIPTSPAPIYGDVIFGDLLPPKFEGARPKLKKAQAQQGQSWDQPGTSTNGAPVTQSTGGFNASPPRQNGSGSNDPNWTPERAQRYDAKQNSIIRQHSQEQAIRLAHAAGTFQGADLSNEQIRTEVLRQLKPLIDWFDADAKADRLIEEAKQAFPGSTEVPNDDIPVGL